jgi:hypothetical protein
LGGGTAVASKSFRSTRTEEPAMNKLKEAYGLVKDAANT